jgi:hypothetical protein
VLASSAGIRQRVTFGSDAAVELGRLLVPRLAGPSPTSSASRDVPHEAAALAAATAAMK